MFETAVIWNCQLFEAIWFPVNPSKSSVVWQIPISRGASSKQGVNWLWSQLEIILTSNLCRSKVVETRLVVVLKLLENLKIHWRCFLLIPLAWITFIDFWQRYERHFLIVGQSTPEKYASAQMMTPRYYTHYVIIRWSI